MNPSRRLIDSAMGMDHRWGRRQPTDVAVRFVAKAGMTGTGRVLNISLTGAYLETRVPLRLLSLVYLEPETSLSGDDTRRRIAASVVRRDALGVGLEWCEFSTGATDLSARLAILTPSSTTHNGNASYGSRHELGRPPVSDGVDVSILCPNSSVTGQLVASQTATMRTIKAPAGPHSV
jgi:hypothetical protein